MKTVKVANKNGNPVLLVGDEELSACAYITYFDDRNDYKEFSKNGFRLYSVSVSLASQPINTQSGFMPFEKGVFDVKGKPDFSCVDASIKRVVDSVPNAYIFPRIYVCMPSWWIKENLNETIDVPHDKKREMIFCEKFRADAQNMLKQLIEYLENGKYADYIIGYQISGGNTQEWFHLDLNGSYCENTLPYFNKYLKNKYPDIKMLDKLPDIDKIKSEEFIEDSMLTEYLLFANEEVAKTVDCLCKATKEACNYKKITGAFYGYSLEVCNPLWGTHALEKILDSKNIDFLSSPNSYTNGRALGIDWADMIPVDSVKLHGKMCFMECDIRTFLTMSPEESRPGSDPMHYYSHKVWEGPKTEELSAYAIRKSLARQLTHKHGLWWFDMFGHWYKSPKLMEEMKTSLKLYDDVLKNNGAEFETEVVVFIDEKCFSKMGNKHPAHDSAYHLKVSLGQSGVPYKVYLISDFDKIDLEKYKVVIFNIPLESKFIDEKIKFLNKKGIATLKVGYEKPTYSSKELYEFFKKSGVHLYCNSLDVCYIGNGFASLHASKEGLKKICFPMTVKCTDIDTGKSVVTNVLEFDCKKFETKLFIIKNI